MYPRNEIQISKEGHIDPLGVNKDIIGQARVAELTAHMERLEAVIKDVDTDIRILENSLVDMQERRTELLSMKNQMLMGCFDAFCGRMPS